MKDTVETRCPNQTKMCSLDFSFYVTFFYVGPPKEDFFFDHLLWSIFQSSTHIYAAAVSFLDVHGSRWVGLFSGQEPCTVLVVSTVMSGHNSLIICCQGRVLVKRKSVPLSSNPPHLD